MVEAGGVEPPSALQACKLLTLRSNRTHEIHRFKNNGHSLGTFTFRL
jgi:hypothetical protein